MVDPNKIDYTPCPNCGGKIMYLGSSVHTPSMPIATRPIHTLICIGCQSMWDIEVKTERLQEAWEDICNRETEQ